MLNRSLLSFSVWRCLKEPFRCVATQLAGTRKQGMLVEAHPEHLQLEQTEEAGALESSQDDISEVATHLQNTFNFAAYVNRSETLQNLVKLGVDLSRIEKKPYVAETLLALDFEKDMKSHLFFLKEYVADGELGKFITKNPMIFKEDIGDLEVRVNYLMSKNFKDKDICRLVTQNPFWLMFSTVRIDKRLGYFQKMFELTGTEVRELTIHQPKIITYNLHHIYTNTFVVKEEMGFEDHEVKRLLLKKPNIWMIDQLHLIRRFLYIHNKMKISHDVLLKYPEVLLCREFRIKQRHSFLEELGRAQYDAKKENYVPLISLAAGTDVDFCKNIAKCTVDDFNTFLKTL